MKYLFCILIALLSVNLFSQTRDSIKQVPKKDTLYFAKKDTLKFPFNYNKITNRYFTHNSDSITIDDFIWNDRRNLTEIFSLNSSYKTQTFGNAGRSIIRYLTLTEHFTGFYRDGIPLTDPFNPVFDIENISVNEIEKIEIVSTMLSFLYGQNSDSKAINIITKDPFTPNMFSQLRYTQDRDGAMFADVNFTYPISRKLNISIGINNHGSDGNYRNSQFSLWRGRMRLNYFPSNKFNITLNYYQNKLQRGMFGGVLDRGKDTILNYNLAKSINTEAYENNWNYFGNVILNFKLLKDNLSKIIFYSQNNTRSYYDSENSSSSNFILKDFNTHSIQYGVKATQDYNLQLNKNLILNFQAGADYQYNASNESYFVLWMPLFQYVKQNLYNDFRYFNAYIRSDLKYKNLSLSGGIKNQTFNGSNFTSYGIEGSFLIPLSKDFTITFKGGAKCNKNIIPLSYFHSNLYYGKYYYMWNVTDRYGFTGFDIYYKNLSLKSDIYITAERYLYSHHSASFKSDYFDAMLSFSHYKNRSEITSAYSITSDISFHNYFFNNKLLLKIGILNRYDDMFYAPEYYPETMKYSFDISQYHKTKIFNADAYIGARIGKANISLVFANIFNNLNYDTYLYPYDNRGGFLNSLSRFTITWDFWN